MTKRLHSALLAGACATLVACGGGGGGDATPAPEVNTPPASAGANSQGFLAYIASFANRMWEDAEPRDVSNFTAPSDDTDAQEPIATSIDA